VKTQTTIASPKASGSEHAQDARAVVSSGLRRFLYATAAVTGAAVMVVEILGAKMLSPYVGMSHFVWTAQIAVTLVALAAGYYGGGRLADKGCSDDEASPAPTDLAKLFWAILGAAVYLAITVIICKPVAYWCLDFNLAVGSLLASTILFFVPLALLAMTAPFLIRALTGSLSVVGGNVGRLTAISTLGSFAGTMLIGYVIIPFLPNSIAMYLMASSLMLVCALYFGVFRVSGQNNRGDNGAPRARPVVLILFLMISCGFGMRASLTTQYNSVIELFHGNSHFGQLQVLDVKDANRRFYLNDFLTQNTYDPVRKQSMSHFTYMLSGLAQAYTTNIHDVLCIGLGIGIVPMTFANSGARVDVAEINPAVVPVAEKFFDLQPQKLHLTIDDGRHYLNRCTNHYDAVVLDAFLGDSSPSHLFTKEAFESMHRVLRPGGVLVINAFGDVESGKDFFTASLKKTLKAVFKEVRIHTSGDGGMFFVAADRTPLEFVRQPDFSNVHPYALRDTQDSYSGIVDTEPSHGIVLTDNYNPAEFYDAHNREEIRRNLARSAREL
jgi:spermidine synthase